MISAHIQNAKLAAWRLYARLASIGIGLLGLGALLVLLIPLYSMSIDYWTAKLHQSGSPAAAAVLKKARI